ncbi:hypothetical protein ACSBM8_00670 [Sphingomonas sp. ASY06-1R]|uniref:hypothetical protein n=1 Tax=Sphingomonas sp. ASY06-1R TaxID=3445771 RepID=UPI003FA31942
MAELHTAEAPAPASADERVEEFAEFLDRMEEDQADEDHPNETGTPAGEDYQEEATEPGDPAIAPPISWDSEARELFEQLPPDLQSKVAAREAQRERALQSVSTEAAEVKRHALIEANAAVAEQQRAYAAQLEEIAGYYAPQRPDPALLAEDPQAFYQLQAMFESQAADHQALTQRALEVQAEAAQREAINQHYALAQDHALLGAHLGDDWTDVSRRQALLTDLEQVGATLGYSMELMGQANATDILALKAAAEWKAKADRYDALQSGKPAAVRAARAAPRVARPGVTPTRAEQSARGRDAAWARAKAERSGDAYAAVLDSMGITL